MVRRALLATHHDPDRNARRHHPRGVGQRLGRHEQRAAGARVGRIPAELADGEAVPVGRYQPDGVVVNLEVYPGDDRQRVVAAGRGRDLADRGGEHAAVDGARQPGQLRQPRILLDREGHQGEGRRAAGHGHVVFLVIHLDRERRQAPGDLGQQAPGHERGARFGDLGVEENPGRHLVVEAGQGQAIRGGLEQQPRQNGQHRARWQRARDPGDRLSQRVPLDDEPHSLPPPSRVCHPPRGPYMHTRTRH